MDPLSAAASIQAVEPDFYFPASFDLSGGPVTAVRTSSVPPQVQFDSTGVWAKDSTGAFVFQLRSDTGALVIKGRMDVTLFNEVTGGPVAHFANFGGWTDVSSSGIGFDIPAKPYVRTVSIFMKLAVYPDSANQTNPHGRIDGYSTVGANATAGATYYGSSGDFTSSPFPVPANWQGAILMNWAQGLNANTGYSFRPAANSDNAFGGNVEGARSFAYLFPTP